MKKLITISFAFILCFGSLLAEDDSWLLNGQIRLRSELDGRDFSDATFPLSFASIRTRIGLKKNIMSGASFFAQIQDSRVLGSEENTMSNSMNLDFHQAFVKLNDPFGLPISVQAGRFEVSYGTQRFLGAVGWHYVGRSFDGVRFSFDPGFNLDVFALTLGEAKKKNKDGKDKNPYIGNANPGAYGPYPDGVDSYSMYGFWTSNKLNDNHNLDVFGYYEFNRNKAFIDDTVLTKDFLIQRPTIGLSHWGTFGDLKTILEVAFQTGTTGAKDVSAYLASFQANYNLGQASVGAGIDILSGTEPSDMTENNSFAPTFATNHKFYGFMDYFINVPVNSGGLGLNDVYVKLNYIPKRSPQLNFNLMFHMLMANQENANGDSNFGKEIDITIKYLFNRGVTITWGGSVFLPDELMKTMFKSNEDMAFWSYIMITANIN